jgi:hypothetical protein
LGNLFEPVDVIDIAYLFNVGRKPSMNTKYFVIYRGRESKTIEDISKGSPDIERTVLSDTFIVETINLRNQS